VPLAVLADAELVVTTYLRNQPDVFALVGTQVSTELPASPVFPLLRVSRIGGTPAVPRRLDAAHLQIEAWATTKATARNVAATAHAALWAAGNATNNGAVITGVDDTLGLSWLPDPVTGRPRYIFGVAVYIHPA
jgi:hypothetical protein